MEQLGSQQRRRVGAARLLAVLSALALAALALLFFWPDPEEAAPASTGTLARGRTAPAPGSSSPGALPGERASGTEGREVAPAAEERLFVEVLDQESRAAVATASVHLMQKGRELPAATTDQRGRAELAADGAADALLAVVHEGHATALVDLAAPLPERVRVELEPEGRIFGFVSLRGGLPTGEGLHVIATEAGLRASTEELVGWWISGDPRVHAARTDGTGAFRIGGLRRGASYHIRSGGNGYVLRTVPSTSPDGRPLDLEVDVLYAAALRFREADGGSASIFDPAGARAIGILPTRVSGGREGPPVGTGWAHVFLAGLDTSWLAAPASARIALDCSAYDDPSYGPVGVRGTWPGYRPWSASFDLRRLRDGPAEVDVPLERTAAGWGAVVVVFEPFDPPGRPSGGTLRLEGQGESLGYDVKIAGDGRCRIAGIPFGTYRASFQSLGFRHPAQGAPEAELEVGERDAELRVPTAGLGGLRFEPAMEDGTPYGGPLKLSLMAGARPRGENTFATESVQTCWFTGPPYEVAGLAAGTYVAVVTTPRPAAAVGTPPPSAEVRAGEWTPLSFSVRP